MDEIRDRLNQFLAEKLKAAQALHEEKLRQNKANFLKFEADFTNIIQLASYIGGLVEQANGSNMASLGYKLEFAWNEAGYRRQLDLMRSAQENPSATIPAGLSVPFNVTLRGTQSAAQPRPGLPANHPSNASAPALLIHYLGASNTIRLTVRTKGVSVKEYSMDNYRSGIANDLFDFISTQIQSGLK